MTTAPEQDVRARNALTAPLTQEETLSSLGRYEYGWADSDAAGEIAQRGLSADGQRVLERGSVGYFWQDDSRRNELERIQTFARVRDTPADLPLRWFLAT